MSVNEIAEEFKRKEKEIFERVCAEGRKELREWLEARDGELMRERDRGAYRHKGKRKTTVKTRLGEVEYRRAVYERKGEDGAKRFSYLLDEAAGLDGKGQMSAGLCGLIAESACEGTYRQTARAVSEMTGQAISHAGAWGVVQELGARVDAHEREAAALAGRGEGRGKLWREALFEERDGVWLHLQGASRRRHGKSKEMKIGIAYDGFERSGAKRWRLSNKVAAAHFEGAGAFARRMEGRVAEKYDTDAIRLRVVNGDGAAWLKPRGWEDGVHFQLDPFHRNRAVLEGIANPEEREKAMGLLMSGETGQLLPYLSALAEGAADGQGQERLRKLRAYLEGNKEGLLGWRDRGIEIPAPPEGLEYRGLGAMEGNVFTIIGNRMKGGRKCWGVNGANNLAGLLALKHTGRLRGELELWDARPAPEGPLGGEPAPSPMIPGYAGKGYEPARGGAAPATAGWKLLREIGRGGGAFA